MHDHLKDAAVAASMSDHQLLEAHGQIDSEVEPTGEQQATMDEMDRRGLSADEAAA